jgi:hypothetical protein
MKLPPVLLFLIAATTTARDFRPEAHLENISASDSSIQECYVFRTTAGVRYTVESSSNLTNWTVRDRIYGLGNEYVVSMRQFTAPPPPEPGTPPPTVLVPSWNASLMMRPASDPAGGTVVSWVSLDDGSPVIVKIAGTMDLAWASIPLFADHYGDYGFFIWHPVEEESPPTENPMLGTNDSAMLAVLEASLPAMNAQVAASLARSRNTPAPVQTDPEAAKFWRVHCDWSVDTDQDGTTDWAEFEMAANATAGIPVNVLGDFQNIPAPTGNAFSSDSNSDGIPDGEQLDSDNDGTADVFDIASSDATATYEIGPLPSYALFPITNAQPQLWMRPFQISDKGTVIYRNGTWSSGAWTELNLPADELDIPGYGARAINDHNVILGISTLRTSDQNREYEFDGYCSWASPSATRSFVTAGAGDNKVYAEASHGLSDEFFSRHPYPGPILSNDGHFNAFTWGKNLNHYQHNSRTLHPAYWKLSSPGAAATEQQEDHRLFHNQEPSLRWGGGYPLYDPEGLGYGTDEDHSQPFTSLIYAPNLLPELSFSPMNLIPRPGGLVLALPAAYADEQTQAFSQGAWKTSPTFAKALDIAEDGTAIGRNHDGLKAPILLNGKWTDIKQYAPSVPAEWADINTSLLDTTPSGWILASRYMRTNFYGVMLPLRLDGVNNSAIPANLEDPAAGVDRTSMGALSGTGYVPEIWIMAPVSGSNTVRFRTPLNTVSTLKLQCEKVTFTPDVLNTADQQIQISGNATTTEDVQPVLKLGNQVESQSVPLKIKVMKKRIVRLALHKVIGLDENGLQTSPSNFPTKVELEDYLNEIYGRQVNTYFSVTVYEEKGQNGLGIDFDGNNDKRINPTRLDSELIAATPNSKSQALGAAAEANIDVWIIGGGVKLGLNSILGMRIQDTFAGVGKLIIDGELAGISRSAERKKIILINTIAHEIGHVMIADGHPDTDGPVAVLRWKQSMNGISKDQRDQQRLMYSKETLFLPGEQLIKKEWDNIEEWLNLEEMQQRIIN